MDKDTVIRNITDCAKQYDNNLNNCNLLLIFGDPHKAEFFEALFLPRNFLHLTGVVPGKEFIGNSSNFYNACLDGRLSPDDFSFRNDGTTQLKIQALPKLMQLHKTAKMIGDYDKSRALLSTEKIAGTVLASMGFKREGDYYVPNTVLKEDVRNITHRPQQRVLAILKKTAETAFYDELCYLAKDIELRAIRVPPLIAAKCKALLSGVGDNPITAPKEQSGMPQLFDMNTLNQKIAAERARDGGSGDRPQAQSNEKNNTVR